MTTYAEVIELIRGYNNLAEETVATHFRFFFGSRSPGRAQERNEGIFGVAMLSSCWLNSQPSEFSRLWMGQLTSI